MKLRTLPATEAKNRFGRVLREVARSGGPIFIERDGRPVAVILSVREYERSRRRPAPPPDKLMPLRSAFGMWSHRADITDDWVFRGRIRWASEWLHG
jgi:prevent-host-death family protein